MSTEAITWALSVHGLSPRAKLVLIGLADSADKATWTCYPARKVLAEIGDCSIKTVDRAISELVEAKLIVRHGRTRDSGGQSSNLYTVHPSRIPAATPSPKVSPPLPKSVAGGETNPGRGEGHSYDQGGATRGVPPYEPSLEPEESRIVSARGDVSVPVSKEAIGALIARAGDACDPTAPSLHHGAQLNRLLRGGCLWADDIEPACDQVAASFRRRGKRFSSWELLIEHAVANRDARLAGLPPPQPVTDQPRRGGGQESPTSVIQRLAREGRI